MSSPFREEFHSDAEPTVVINSCSNVPKSPASDHSDIICDPILLERELALEGLQRASTKSEKTDDLRLTISYEEALEREFEYQKRVKMIMLQPTHGSTLLPTSSQGLPPKPSSGGVKRKAVCGALGRTVSGGGHDSVPPPSQFQDRQAAPQLMVQPCHPSLQQLQAQQPMGQRAQVQKPLSQGLTNRQPLAQGLKFGQASTQLVQDRQLTKYQPKGQQFVRESHSQQQPKPLPVWCHLCRVNCVTPHNLKNHCQGKKHKSKLELLERMTSSVSNVAGTDRVVGQAGSSKQQ